MQPEDEPVQRGRPRLSKAMMSGIALLGVGALAGGIASTAISASAATTTTAATGSSGSGASSSTSSTVPGSGRQRPAAPPGASSLPLHGTITAVGDSSVSIKTSSGSATYAVTSTSDIEKKDKTTLSALSVGDTVAFSTVTSDGTTAIDTLVAGPRPRAWPEAVVPVGGQGPGYRPPNTTDRIWRQREFEQLEQFEQLGTTCLIHGSEHLGSGSRSTAVPVGRDEAQVLSRRASAGQRGSSAVPTTAS